MGNEIIRRVIRSEIKSIDEKEFTVDVTMSDETVDRYKEVILASAWKKRLSNYKNHPILLSSHNYHGLMNQIGEAPKIGIKDGALVAKFKYFAKQGNPEADWAWVLASKGVAAYSVGFIRHSGRYVDPDEDYEDDDEMKAFQKSGVQYVYDDVELLECSHVTVPANPSCLQNSFDQGVVMRSLEEKAFPMMAELEAELKKLVPKEVKRTRTKSTDDNEEEMKMELTEFKEMMETLKVKFATDFETQMKGCIETMTDTLKTAADEMVKKTVEALDVALEERKVQEVKEVAGEVKAAEVIVPEVPIVNETDGVLDVFKAITAEMEKTFSVPS